MRASPVTTDIDFTKQGIQHGHLSLPYSQDLSAWGAIRIPLSVINNGEGPTALLTGANHGDEYEGPVALMDFVNSVSPSDISGRVICVPMMNYPAFRSAKRTSPIDSGNMNRVFPGNPDGALQKKLRTFSNAPYCQWPTMFSIYIPAVKPWRLCLLPVHIDC